MASAWTESGYVVLAELGPLYRHGADPATEPKIVSRYEVLGPAEETAWETAEEAIAAVAQVLQRVGRYIAVSVDVFTVGLAPVAPEQSRTLRRGKDRDAERRKLDERIAELERATGIGDGGS